MKKELKKIDRAARAAGWTVKVTGKGHTKYFSPNGSDIVLVSGTPSHQATIKKIKADFSRAGTVL